MQNVFPRRTAAVMTLAALTIAGTARAEDILRIAMTASDLPTTTGAPNNGFEGVRFLGYPSFEGLVLWDLSPSDKPAVLRPGLAERWEQAPLPEWPARSWCGGGTEVGDDRLACAGRGGNEGGGNCAVRHSRDRTGRLIGGALEAPAWAGIGL